MKKYKELKVYITSWCHTSEEALLFLDENNLPYEKIDIEKVKGAAEKLEEVTGKRGVPYFEIDGEWVKPYAPGLGFFRKEMKKYFEVE